MHICDMLAWAREMRGGPVGGGEMGGVKEMVAR